jgi:BlaR1 peptidase M56
VVYALVVGALVAAAAWAAEGLSRQHRLPVRWSWALGLVGMAALIARSATSPGAGARIVLPLAERTSATPLPALRGPSAWHSLVAAFDAGVLTLGRAMDMVAGALPRLAGESLALCWLLASGATIVVIALVHLRIARVRREWPRARLHGHDVRIAPAIGPAVLGVVRPFIVVPRWLLSRSADEQRLVLEHEGEHVRGRDPLLLTAAWAVVAMVPWHPAAWWMLSRLRLAIELDCDARILRRGIAPGIYGTLLIDLAGQCAASPVGATALADESSHLERRLLAMNPLTSRHAPLRNAAFLGAGFLATLAACEAKIPTSAEVEKMDVAGAQRAVVSAGMGTKVSMNDADFTVDGKPTTAEAAHAIPSNRIASVSVGTSTSTGRSLIAITTGENSGGFPMKIEMRHADSAAMGTAHSAHAKEMSRTFSGVMYLDGVKVDNAVMARLDPTTILSVEVVKGATATALSSDPAAVNGVIRITTKASARK